MRRVRVVMSACGLLAATAWCATAVDAQTPANVVYSACYVPASGTVYRVGELGLPVDCLSPGHVRFSWNSLGAAGIVGPAGTKGDSGAMGATGATGAVGAA
ncbi:MAG: hypothetical protein Q8K82_09640, partial [Gemmatimonadaceae bacterium]|nr:hypothetical protein [Gemmatimonadaceae bacterium]